MAIMSEKEDKIDSILPHSFCHVGSYAINTTKNCFILLLSYIMESLVYYVW